MQPLEEKKYCLACNKTIKGRADKKFCDDYCRNTYNNSLNAKKNMIPLIRNTNNALLKNHRILASLLPLNEEMTKVNYYKLIEKGFLFKFHTHTYDNQNGNVYFFCYNYGYLALENNWYLIVHSKEEALQ